MNYNEIIEEAFTNIINTCSKLSVPDKNYTIRQLAKIGDHLNRQTEDNKRLVEKIKGMPAKSYDDAFEYFADIMNLHGYNPINSNRDKYKKFIRWFNKSALIDKRYSQKHITAAIIDSFVNIFIVFELNFEREPKNYEEFRNFFLNFNDEIDKKILSDLKNIEGELGIELDNKEKEKARKEVKQNYENRHR